jgi:hypothetical protein
MVANETGMRENRLEDKRVFAPIQDLPQIFATQTRAIRLDGIAPRPIVPRRRAHLEQPNIR